MRWTWRGTSRWTNRRELSSGLSCPSWRPPAGRWKGQWLACLDLVPERVLERAPELRAHWGRWELQVPGLVPELARARVRERELAAEWGRERRG